MLPLDPKKMRQMLKMAGIKLEEVNASEVIIKRETGDLIIEEPQVMKLI
ncbi:MAG TPA: nascent polypeptide-associated complex protein, partial [Candidatus Aenigmarchaeota archaeon]|nr:nascent polypeptide-associated complex protein [Candidatus Aenigmarchaeota archaeon]